MLDIESRALHVLGTDSTIELHLQSSTFISLQEISLYPFPVNTQFSSLIFQK
jgi:hypothetical protein